MFTYSTVLISLNFFTIIIFVQFQISFVLGIIQGQYWYGSFPKNA